MMATINLYSKEQIDEKQIGTPDDTASASGSLWARIKNALSRIGVLETADTNNVKKTGTSTVTGTLQVPTTPPTPTSAINSVYANDATEGVNNLLHKTGNETKTGQLTVTNHLTTNEDIIAVSSFATPVKLYKTNISKENQQYGGFQIAFYDNESYELARLVCRLREDGSTALVGQARKPNGTWVEQTIIEGIA